MSEVSMQLRWFKKDGQEPVLQQEDKNEDSVTYWQDVPTVEERSKPRECWVRFVDDMPMDYSITERHAKAGWVRVREIE